MWMQPINIMKGQGIYNMITESQAKILDKLHSEDEQWEEDTMDVMVLIQDYVEYDPFLEDMRYYLKEGVYPNYLNKNAKRSLKLKSIPYVLLQGKLYKKVYDGTLLQCMSVKELARALE